MRHGTNTHISGPQYTRVDLEIGFGITVYAITRCPDDPEIS